MTAATAGSAQGYLQAQSRWHPLEIAFWLATLLPYVLFPDYLSLASQIAITGLFALSLDLILGYAGVVSLGHAAFFGIGAYAAGILSKTFSFDFFGSTVTWPGMGEPVLGLFFAALMAGLAGYATSFIVARFRHFTLIMITLGIGLIAEEIANRAHWLTGGSDSLQGINISNLLGVFRWDLYGYTAYTYSLIVLFIVFLGVRRLVNSPFGLALRGIRENWVRMPAIAAASQAHLRLAYTIAATIAGIAGALLTQTTQTAALGSINFGRSADVVVMLVLGGAGRLYGGLVGAALYMVARDQFSGIAPQFWFFWIGLMLVGAVLFLPNGVLGGAAAFYRRWRSK
jgi:branched-chain amino acid transport system permease protein